MTPMCGFLYIRHPLKARTIDYPHRRRAAKARAEPISTGSQVAKARAELLCTGRRVATARAELLWLFPASVDHDRFASSSSPHPFPLFPWQLLTAQRPSEYGTGICSSPDEDTPMTDSAP